MENNGVSIDDLRCEKESIAAEITSLDESVNKLTSQVQLKEEMQSCFQIKHDAEVRGLLNKLTRPRMRIIKARSQVTDVGSKLELTETLIGTVNEDIQHESFP